ncbi:MAG: ABC-2 transporter permease [Geothermobacteraceae bacterium]
MNGFSHILRATVVGLLRDRVLHAIVGAGLLILVLVPLLSGFSMRQVRELAITLSLSCNSLVLLVLAIMLGAASIWRDVERRYTASLLGLPLARHTYIAGRFAGIAVFLLVCGAFLGLCGCVVVWFMRTEMSAGLALNWFNLVLAVWGDICRSILLLALAVLFSSISTSLFLPVFGTLGIYLAGSASQEVMDYLATEAGKQLPQATRTIAEILYFILPNFSVFDFKVYAVYGLATPLKGAMFAAAYFVVYGGIVLLLAIRLFSRRELP